MDTLQKAIFRAQEYGSSIKHLEGRNAPITLRYARALWSRELAKFDDPIYVKAIRQAYADAYEWTESAVEDDDIAKKAAEYGAQMRCLQEKKDVERLRVGREWRAFRDGLDTSAKQSAANLVYWTTYWATKPGA